MKRLNHVLAAAAAIVTVNLVYQAGAAEPVASPRLRETLAWQRTVPGTTEDKLDRSIKPVSPRLQERLNAFRSVPAGNDPDLAHPAALVYWTFKNPFPKAAELAPLK
ncbi:MAG: hypothetical protein KGS61_15165 [Verrucomicrobia bacterium]|nr:hypothetical protein [Verrucomicrobiota bacterium]